LGARIVYLPLYVYGIPNDRTVLYLISLAGLAMVIGLLVFA